MEFRESVRRQRASQLRWCGGSHRQLSAGYFRYVHFTKRLEAPARHEKRDGDQ